ncbi:hypothetical protein [Pedobacter miscanthi]|jgi:hypothetical protein|uniref:hypothetical protein n=1 Tax=Pedobacter miscanthi TaxID=2259170 RepID=UPI00292CDBAA|nr:hypothetical protein [Pedobacter miscanthi]
MENLENNQPEEEIQNIEQFQIDRSNGNAADGHNTPESDDDEYTENEVQFADGEGTQLNEEIEGPDDEENEEAADDYNESDIEELDNDPNAYDEDDSEML